MESIKFSGVLCLLDEPSDNAPGVNPGVDRSKGVQGRQVIIPKGVARKALSQLTNSPVNCKPDFTGHSTDMIGKITRSYIEDNKLMVEGIIFDPSIIKSIQSFPIGTLGMSLEMKNAKAMMYGNIAEIRQANFTGVAICLRSKAAFSQTTFRINEVKEKPMELKEEMSKYLSLINTPVVNESWDKEMKTKEKDKDMFKGRTLASLKAELKKLTDNPKKTAALKKKEKEIEFAIRAKQKKNGKWGKIKEDIDEKGVCSNCGYENVSLQEKDGEKLCGDCYKNKTVTESSEYPESFDEDGNSTDLSYDESFDEDGDYYEFDDNCKQCSGTVTPDDKDGICSRCREKIYCPKCGEEKEDCYCYLKESTVSKEYPQLCAECETPITSKNKGMGVKHTSHGNANLCKKCSKSVKDKTKKKKLKESYEGSKFAELQDIKEEMEVQINRLKEVISSIQEEGTEDDIEFADRSETSWVSVIEDAVNDMELKIQEIKPL